MDPEHVVSTDTSNRRQLPRRGAPESTTLDGLAIDRYAAVGESNGEIVIVHGSMDRAGGFRRLVRHLPDHVVFTYDRRGYDRSISKGVSADLGDHVADLETVISACGSSPLIVGHSFGGLVALALLAARAGGSPHGTDVAGAVVWEPPLAWNDWYPSSTEWIGDRTPGEAVDLFMAHAIGDEVWLRLPEATRAARRAEGPAMLADVEAARNGPVDLASIRCRVIAGKGGESMPHHRRTADEVADVVPCASVVEVGAAGHGVHLSHPAAFADIIKSWNVR